MRKVLKTITKHIMRFSDYMLNEHLGAYATSSAYFFVLSFIPFLLLLMALVKYTILTKTMVTDVILSVVPEAFHTVLKVIINEVYSQSLAVVPVSALMALWSSGKGLQAITNGLNVIYNTKETRNYFVMRIRSIMYTIVFMIAIVATLILMVFGDSIRNFLMTHIHILGEIATIILNIRVVTVTVALTIVFTALYTFVPNHKRKILSQIPGALTVAVSWSLCSFFFSFYVDYAQGTSLIYGSLTTIVMILLWIYICMYLVLIGAEINMALANKFEKGNEAGKEKKKEKKKENLTS